MSMSAPISLSLRVKAPSLQILERRHVGDDAAAFHHLEDAAADDLVGIDAVDALAVEDDLAAGDFAVLGLEQSGDRLQRRRLAGAVGAEQGHDRALRHLEAQAAQHQDDVVVDDLDVAHAEQRRGGWRRWGGEGCFDRFGHELCRLPGSSCPGLSRASTSLSAAEVRRGWPGIAETRFACGHDVCATELTSPAIRACAAGRWS